VPVIFKCVSFLQVFLPQTLYPGLFPSIQSTYPPTWSH
jgi:hypothetical protein